MFFAYPANLELPTLLLRPQKITRSASVKLDPTSTATTNMAPLSLRLCALALIGMSWALPQDGSKSLKARAGDIYFCGTTILSTCPDVVPFFDGEALAGGSCCELPDEPCHFCCDSWDAVNDSLSCHDDFDGPPGEDLCPGNFVVHCGVH